MKVLFASDIHGNYDNFKIVYDFFINEGIDKMIILGDTFTTGNSGDVNSHELSKLLWNIPNKLVLVRGNCDSSFDEELSPVGMINLYEDVIGTSRILCYHGDHYVRPTSNVKIYCSGHTHYFKIDKIDNVFYFNPGSVGRSRDYSGGSFGVISDKNITIFNLKYEVLKEVKL